MKKGERLGRAVWAPCAKEVGWLLGVERIGVEVVTGLWTLLPLVYNAWQSGGQGRLELGSGKKEQRKRSEPKARMT